VGLHRLRIDKLQSSQFSSVRAGSEGIAMMSSL